MPFEEDVSEVLKKREKNVIGKLERICVLWWQTVQQLHHLWSRGKYKNGHDDLGEAAEEISKRSVGDTPGSFPLLICKAEQESEPLKEAFLSKKEQGAVKFENPSLFI